MHIQRGPQGRRDVARRRRWKHSARDESGVSAIEFVLLTPILFFLIFATVQFALYFFARHVALAAAQEGDRVARAEAAHPDMNWKGDATTKANAWINQLAPNLLGGSGVTTDQTGTGGRANWVVSVQVTATVPSILPWGTLTVTETSTGPVEQFIPDN